MIRFRLYFNKDKETIWLNQLAEQGYALSGFFAGFYQFEKCEPGTYVYQIDFEENFGSVSESYREFMQDMGVEIIQNWGYWVFLRKKKADGAFALYTDAESSMEHYKKIRRMFKAVIIIELICLIIETLCISTGSIPTAAIIFIVILFSVILIALFGAVMQINKKIQQLEEASGDITVATRNVSPFLLAGLFVNAVAVVIPEDAHPYLKPIVQITAIALMLIGIYQSRNVFKV